MQDDGISAKGVLGRFLASAVLVYATFNPAGYSFFHWALEPVIRGARETAGAQLPLKLLAGLLLVGIWVFAIQTTRRSIGWKGALLILAILATLVWALVDWHVLNPRSSQAIGHLVLVALAITLALGMSWSHLSRRLSGQVDTDEID